MVTVSIAEPTIMLRRFRNGFLCLVLAVVNLSLFSIFALPRSTCDDGTASGGWLRHSDQNVETVALTIPLMPCVSQRNELPPPVFGHVE